jgi:hypothetical protein
MVDKGNDEVCRGVQKQRTRGYKADGGKGLYYLLTFYLYGYAIDHRFFRKSQIWR